MQQHKHSIATVSLSGTLKEKMKAVAKAGYDGIELFENDLLISDIRPAELKRMSEDLGIEIIALQPFRDYEAMPEPLKIKNLDRAEHKFDLMHALGTKLLSICSNTSPHAINDMDKAAEDLYDIATRAASHGFKIAYEALSWGRHVNTYHQSVDIVRRANHPNLGNLLDNFHISVLGMGFDEIYNIPKEKLFLVQVADGQKFDMSAIYLARHLRSFPGQGTYPVVEYLNAVNATGYEGYISHEIFNDDFRASLIDPVALDGKRSLIWLDGVSKKKPVQSSEDLKSSEDYTPETVVLNDIEFIEFSTDTETQNDLIHILRQLGFVETHQHKTKDVSLYQLGAVNIVLNRQESTHASKYFKKHGNAVCAIGLTTDNQETPQYWAEKLQYEWVNSSSKSDELRLPSVKGLGDVLYYFVDQNDLKSEFYEVEYNLTNAHKNENSIKRIDHIGHTVSNELFLSNTLFYRAMLGLDIEESLEILDPRGIVYSRVAKNKNKQIRIPLSSTRSSGTSLDNFIEKSGGTGIQQIALQTDDIFETAAFIQDKSLVLPIPANYYDDLLAKTNLSKTTIDNMQTFNILYDKQENGSFFHFYLKELNGLFIEIVQRTGTYDRYGEVNAQVRLASQERDRQKQF
jgi:4-hydroxyphenylpyruvate dioxygenase